MVGWLMWPPHQHDIYCSQQVVQYTLYSRVCVHSISCFVYTCFLYSQLLYTPATSSKLRIYLLRLEKSSAQADSSHCSSLLMLWWGGGKNDRNSVEWAVPVPPGPGDQCAVIPWTVRQAGKWGIFFPAAAAQRSWVAGCWATFHKAAGAWVGPSVWLICFSVHPTFQHLFPPLFLYSGGSWNSNLPEDLHPSSSFSLGTFPPFHSMFLFSLIIGFLSQFLDTHAGVCACCVAVKDAITTAQGWHMAHAPARSLKSLTVGVNGWRHGGGRVLSQWPLCTLCVACPLEF